MIAGSIMVAVAIVGGLLGSVLSTRGVDLNDVQRDVVVEGSSEVLVPGEIRFRVVEPLGDSSGDQGMTVGIALDGTSAPECSIHALGAGSGSDPGDESGETGEERVERARVGEELVDGRTHYRVRWTARLDPGTYVARCGEEGERGVDANFTVGRVIGYDDVSTILGPMLRMLLVGLIAGVTFLIGVILLIVGLVQKSRSRRTPTYPGYPPSGYAPGGNPPPGYPPNGYPPSGYPPPAPYAPPTQSGHPPPFDYPPPAPSSPPAPAPAGPGAPVGSGPPAGPPTAPPVAPDPGETGEVNGWTIPPSKR